MAEIAEVKEIVPKIAKVSEIEAKAKEIKEKRALPEKPGNVVKFHELMSWIALLPPEAEDRVTIWIYRTEPIINRQLVDPSSDNNIDIIYSGLKTFDEAYMIRTHAGGSYKFVIKDEDKPVAQKGGFFEARLTIPMQDCPPNLDLREVEWDNPKNKGFKSWCRSRKMIDENNMPVIEKKDNPGTPVVNGLDGSMMKMMLDFVTKTTEKMTEKEQLAIKRQLGGEEAVTKSMNELFLAKLQQEDPNKQITSFATLITAMKGMAPEQKPDNTLAVIMPMFMQMMTMANEAANRQMTMMMEMFKSNNKPEKEEGSKIDELKAIVELAREIKGGPNAHADKTITESIVEALPSVLGIIGNVTSMLATAKGVKAPVEVLTPQPQQHNASSFRVLHEQNTMTQPAPQQNTPMINANEAANMIQQFGAIIMNKLSGEGWEFAAWVSEGFGDVAAASLAKYGPDALLVAAKSVPQFWQQVETSYGEAHMKKWLTSLCNYKEIIAQIEAEEREDVEDIKEKVQ